jgi:hydrogenase expression/formation protein HypE
MSAGSDRIALAEGGGGEAMHRLIARTILGNLTLTATPGGTGLEALDDGAVIDVGGTHLVLTTDSYVVRPLFFRGGDIGKLAVTGTLNDLAVMGARPLALTFALVIAEGFGRDDLARIVRSAGAACAVAQVPIVTGDTKVVEGGGGVIVNTAGIGIAETVIRDAGAREGDHLLLNGGIGEHGVAILSQREGIDFDTAIVSDCAPVGPAIQELLASGIAVHAAKDPTRGGIASALNEMASKAGLTFLVREEAVPVRPGVRSACEMLGLDPLEIANEGKVLLAVPAAQAAEALAALRRRDPLAADIGVAAARDPGRQGVGGDVVLATAIGGRRLLRTPLGDPIPRVC